MKKKGKIHTKKLQHTKCGIDLISVHSRHIQTIESTKQLKHNFNDLCKKCFKKERQCSIMIDMDNYERCTNIGNNIQEHTGNGYYGKFTYITFACDFHNKGDN